MRSAKRCCDREGEVLSPAVKRRGREAETTPLHLVPSLRLRRATPLLPLYTFVSCARKNLSLSLPSMLYSSPNTIRVTKSKRMSKSKTEKQFTNAFILQVFATGI